MIEVQRNMDTTCFSLGKSKSRFEMIAACERRKKDKKNDLVSICICKKITQMLRQYAFRASEGTRLLSRLENTESEPDTVKNLHAEITGSVQMVQ